LKPKSNVKDKIAVRINEHQIILIEKPKLVWRRKKRLILMIQRKVECR
jgi:hypothetical protein